MNCSELTFELAHIGINCDSESEATKLANTLSSLFDFKVKVGNSSVFASKNIEIMKSNYLGEKGHIGIKTNNIDMAIDKLSAMGYKMDMQTLKVDENGDKKAVYLCDEMGGFAFHLLKAE